jgi:hypothetical protein
MEQLVGKTIMKIEKGIEVDQEGYGGATDRVGFVTADNKVIIFDCMND